MEIKNKKTGYVFEISDIEGKKLITDNDEEFEPIDKKFLSKQKKPKTVREKVMGVKLDDSCLKALTKEQIIQELKELCVTFNPKARKKELIEILKKQGGF